MEYYNRKKWEDLDLSKDEIKNIGEALQKEEFRSLLIDYVKEISDPENRKLYEAEITQLENERGVDVKFIHPSPGYVIKTSVNGKGKAFINICSNDNVGKPSSTPGVDDGHKGLRWSIPYCLAPPREDFDKKNNLCMVYDVVFHPDTLHIASSNEAFKHLVNNTALEAVEDNFSLSLDKVNLRFPRMSFKGVKNATVIRKKIKDFKASEVIDIPNYPYPPPQEQNCTDSKSFIKRNHVSEISKPKYETPKYRLKHRNTVDMQTYTNDPLSKMAITIPDELVIEVDLPLLKNCRDASIDVTEKTLYLSSESPAKYKLHLNLPYMVDSNKGSAKFDNVRRVLIVVLPVIKNLLKLSSFVDSAREDSGVECDNYNGRNNSMSSSDDDTVEKNELGKSLRDRPASNSDSELYELRSKSETFLNQNTHYILPSFDCHKEKDMLTFTLNVPNVNPKSVEYCFLRNSVGFHLTFSSVGSGYFPVHYAMYVLLPLQASLDKETFNVEVWDNNVIAQVKFTSKDIQLLDYEVGINKESLRKFYFPRVEDTKPSKQVESQVVDNANNFEENSEEKSIDLVEDNNNFNSNPNTSVIKVQEKSECSSNKKSCDEAQEKMGIPVSQEEEISENLLRDLYISESTGSSFDESTSSPTHHPSVKLRTYSESQNAEVVRNKSRGILKIGRSLSESSVDDYGSWTGENIEKPKKTVRFSEVILKQTFRMNSSILGQRKKNQRKTRNKKRALERRLSESGGESEGENDGAPINGNNPFKNKDIDVWLKEPDCSSCEASEVSEVSDVSESDDGQKEDIKPFMPCSSKKNHKRRGKKSARKSAATAKIQYMEN